MIFISALRKNDINPDSGKQIEFSKQFFEQFGWEDETEHEVTFHFKNKEIKSLLKVRGGERKGVDCKEYIYEGKLPLKEFFIKTMHLDQQHVGKVYFIIEPLDMEGKEFNLYFVPEKFDVEPGKTQFDKVENGNSKLGPLQQIFYGAPGTGKSHKTDKVASDFTDTIRTTFHPDSDYSTFVGAYKPTMEEVNTNVVPVVLNNGINLQEASSFTEKRISYKFIKQAFLKAYIKAWNSFIGAEIKDGTMNLSPQFLIIEEINRGNCAQIFGDLFQLLDRKKCFSEYPIDADEDIRKALLDDNPDDDLSFGADGLQLSTSQIAYINSIYDEKDKPSKHMAEKICSGQLLAFPANLYIWATMNTSDQSLFPIDSAFKRRWEWKYIPIIDKKENYKIQVKKDDGKTYDYDWWDFLQKVNVAINNFTNSEDKKLGYFFCKTGENNKISADKFVSKVLFYLYNDVFKDSEGDEVSFSFEGATYSLLKWKDGDKQDYFTFSDFFDEEGNGKDIMVAKFLDNIKVKAEEAKELPKAEEIGNKEPTKEKNEEEEDLFGNKTSETSPSGRNYDKFSVNGEGSYPKNSLAAEAIKKYVSLHNDKTASEILSDWSIIDKLVPHCIESKTTHESRTDKAKDWRHTEIMCSDEPIYVENNGYGANGAVDKLIEIVNNSNLGIILKRL